MIFEVQETDQYPNLRLAQDRAVRRPANLGVTGFTQSLDERRSCPLADGLSLTRVFPYFCFIDFLKMATPSADQLKEKIVKSLAKVNEGDKVDFLINKLIQAEQTIATVKIDSEKMKLEQKKSSQVRPFLI